MNNNLTKHFTIGALSGLVPITLMSFFFNNIIKNNYPYTTVVQLSPIIMGIIHTLVFTFLVEPFNLQNFFMIGMIFAAIYSSYGRFVGEVPQKVFELEDPNYFHLYAIVIWGLFYYVIVQYLYQNL